MRIIFTGGGTMGHIFPIIAVIRKLKELYPSEQLKIFYLGPKHNYGDVLLKSEGVRVRHIAAGKIRRYFDPKNILDIFKAPIGLFQSLFWIFVWSPDIIFSKAGYGGFAPCVAGFILRTPIILQESDAVAGLSSKIISHLAYQIFTSFPESDFPKQKTMFIGNPIRQEILQGNVEKAKEIFNLTAAKPLLLIIGGSLGSLTINNLILEILPDILKNFEVLHQTGALNFKVVENEAKAYLTQEQKPLYHCLPFLNEEQLKHALAAADFVISRAGSGAVSEILAKGKPSILVPLSGSAQEHQLKNALKMQEQGACEVVEEQNLKPNFFLQRLEAVALNPETKKTLSENAQRIARPLAAQQIAKYILEFLGAA